MTQRILASLILLLSILFMPFWISIILALAGIAYFSFFWEAIVLFFLSELLYGVNEIRLSNIFFVSLIIPCATLLIIEFLKKKLRA